MGSDETATATTGGPRVIDVFSGNGCHRAQIIHFFRMQIGARTCSGIDLGSDGPLDRMRRFLGLSGELWIENLGGSWCRSADCWGPVLICIHRWKHRCMRRRRLPMSSTDPRRPRGDLRTTNRQDSTDAPVMAASSISRIKKIIFFGPQYVSH